jgi:23S rRNA pseudouridine1911/1915/1917 synthase
MESLLQQQREGKILKEYSALAAKSKTRLPGFPSINPELNSDSQGKLFVQSAFRPFGPGRKAVRPVLIAKAEDIKREELYTTEIINKSPVSDAGLLFLRLRISKGFRHQIRAHLAWLGLPILSDKLYGGDNFGNGLLALRACSLSFADPSSNKERVYSIPANFLPDFSCEVK